MAEEPTEEEKLKEAYLGMVNTEIQRIAEMEILDCVRRIKEKSDMYLKHVLPINLAATNNVEFDVSKMKFTVEGCDVKITPVKNDA